MPRGDLFVKVRVRRHPDYQVDGINLYIERNVSVFDLLLGTNIRVDTLHGRKLSVSVPPGSNSGTTFSISGQGLPDQRSGQTGNLYVKVTGITPNITNEEIRERLAKIKDEIDISPK
jgi:DnaJ-class molecular chaperone